MKQITQFTVTNVKQFLTELALQKSVIAKRATIPCLATVKIEATATGVILTGTDLDNTLICEIPAQVETPGAFLIEFSTFFDAVKKAKESIAIGAVLNNANDIKVSIEADSMQFTIEGSDAENFPEHPEIKGGYVCTFPGDVLQDLIHKTGFAVTKEQSRFTLAAINFEFGASGLRCVATDGHRLSLADTKNFVKKEILPQNELLPINAARVLQKMIAQNACKFNVLVCTDPVHFVFTSENRKLIARKHTGNFPNYEMVLPKDHLFSVGFNPKTILPTLENALAFADDRTKSISFQPYYNNFVVKAQNDQNTSMLKSTCNFPQNTAPGVSINGQYLIDACKAIDGIVKLDYKDSASQFEIIGENELTRHRFVIMPLRGDVGIMGNMLTDDEKASLSLVPFDADVTPIAVKKRSPKRTETTLQTVSEVEKLLESMRELSDLNNLPEVFTELFGESIDAALVKLGELK